VPRTMLVTGATGVVGHDLVETARRAGWDVVGCSARGAAPTGGAGGAGGAVAWRMGAEPAPAALRRDWDVVVHAAARPRWNLPDATAWEANVVPTGALADVVGPGTHLVHVSTAYAIGLRGDTSCEDRADYRNSYEWSKAAAERLVRDRWPDATIVRPPLVVGRRDDGRVVRFNGLYSIVRAAVTGMLPVFVAETGALSEVVSCCDVTACLLAAADRGSGAGGRTEVLGRGTASATTKEVLDSMFIGLNRWRAMQGGPLFTPPSLVTPDQWHRFYLPFARPHMTQRQRHFTDLLAEFLPYMAITEPLEVTWRVEPVLGCVEQSIVRWAQAFPRLAMATPKPWVGQHDEGDQDDDELETA
jgi:nucleoside-diphosphate-sugar epimerase